MSGADDLCSFDGSLDPISEILNFRVDAGHLRSRASNAIADDSDLVVEIFSVSVDWEHEWTALELKKFKYFYRAQVVASLTLSPWQESFPPSLYPAHITASSNCFASTSLPIAS